MVTMFKVNKRLVLDFYAFDANEWRYLGGEFMTDPSASGFVKILEDEGVDLVGLVIEFK